MKKWLKDFVHNCVVHPAMPFLPVKVANWLHDKNANWAFGLERYDEVWLEQGLMTRKFDESEITKHFTLTSKDLIKFKRDFEQWKTAKLFDEFAKNVGNGLPLEIELEPCLKDVSPLMVCSRQLSIILKYMQKGYLVISLTDCRVFGIDTHTKLKKPTEAEFRSAVIIQLTKLLDAK